MGISGRRGILGGKTRHTRVFAGGAALGALIPAIAVGVALPLGVAGCASYANVPEPESPASVTSPNRRHPKAVMTASLLRVLRIAPPGGPRFAVALPAGMTAESAEEILAALGPGAELATYANADLPTYSIGRIWIRSGKSKVDVFRPVIELGRRDDGTFDRQAITVWLEGGVEPWRVVRTQRWEVGAFPRPYVEAHPGESTELQIPDGFEDGDGAEVINEAPPPPAEDAEAMRSDVPPEAEAIDEITEGEGFVEPQPMPDPTPEAPPQSAPDRDDGIIRIESVDPGR
ncbi:MAG: hypothetical protein DHS20C14_18220 [Phycisphaeraceae bacterium]|nr:MAG: hypothetical protein DHS20C14_18220 [Phycisphaeraceae bacterium]